MLMALDEAGDWTDAMAREWWRDHGSTLKSTASSSEQSSLAVDLGSRGQGFGQDRKTLLGL